jgi:hypothetical protein
MGCIRTQAPHIWLVHSHGLCMAALVLCCAALLLLAEALL